MLAHGIFIILKSEVRAALLTANPTLLKFKREGEGEATLKKYPYAM